MSGRQTRQDSGRREKHNQVGTRERDKSRGGHAPSITASVCFNVCLLRRKEDVGGQAYDWRKKFFFRKSSIKTKATFHILKRMFGFIFDSMMQYCLATWQNNKQACNWANINESVANNSRRDECWLRSLSFSHKQSWILKVETKTTDCFTTAERSNDICHQFNVKDHTGNRAKASLDHTLKTAKPSFIIKRHLNQNQSTG